MAKNGCLGGFRCTKYVLTAINAMYIIIAFVLIGLAAYAKVVAYVVEYSVMGGIIACGVFLLIIASIGIFGTATHHQATLFFYMIILLLLFFVQFIIACICLAVNPAQQLRMFQVAWNESRTIQSEMQKRFNCCGCDTTNGTEFPHEPCLNVTCCKDSSASCCTGNYTAETLVNGNATVPSCPPSCNPCWTVVADKVDRAIKAAGGVGLFFSFTELLGVWMAYRFRNLKDPSADPNQFL